MTGYLWTQPWTSDEIAAFIQTHLPWTYCTAMSCMALLTVRVAKTNCGKKAQKQPQQACFAWFLCRAHVRIIMHSKFKRISSLLTGNRLLPSSQAILFSAHVCSRPAPFTTRLYAGRAIHAMSITDKAVGVLVWEACAGASRPQQGSLHLVLPHPGQEHRSPQLHALLHAELHQCLLVFMVHPACDVT